MKNKKVMNPESTNTPQPVTVYLPTKVHNDLSVFLWRSRKLEWTYWVDVEEKEAYVFTKEQLEAYRKEVAKEEAGKAWDESAKFTHHGFVAGAAKQTYISSIK